MCTYILSGLKISFVMESLHPSYAVDGLYQATARLPTNAFKVVAGNIKVQTKSGPNIRKGGFRADCDQFHGLVRRARNDLHFHCRTGSRHPESLEPRIRSSRIHELGVLFL